MSGRNNGLKAAVIALASVVAVLAVVLAFVLGQRSAEKKIPAQTVPITEQQPAATAAPAETTPAPETPTAETSPVQSAAPVTEPDSPETGTQPPAEADYTGAPRDLDIDMSAGSLIITEGSEFNIKYDEKVIKVERSGDVVEIENVHRHPTASQRRRMDVTITLPYDYELANVEIDFGAGKLTVHELRADTLDLELGAGSAVFSDLYVKESAEIKEGAGELVIKDGEIANLGLQCGAGATRVAAKLTGINRIDAAVGAVDIDCKGEAADYTVTFQTGLGACYYNDEKIARSGSFGEGPVEVNINGGLGVMRVNAG